MHLDPSRPDYSGAVHIDLKVAAATSSFRFYAKNMDVISVRLSNAAGEVSTSFEPGAGGQIVVQAAAPIAAGDYGLDVDFQNNFDQRANGLYRVKSGTDWYCFTQF